MEDKKYVVVHKPTGIYKQNYGATKNFKGAQTFSSLAIAKNSAMQFRSSYHLRYALNNNYKWDELVPLEEIAVEEYVMKKGKTYNLTQADINDRLTKRQNREKARRVKIAEYEAEVANRKLAKIKSES